MRESTLKVGDDVVIKRLEDSRQDLLYRDYVGRVMQISESGEYAFVDSDEVGLFQSVSFKKWFPVDKLRSIDAYLRKAEARQRNPESLEKSNHSINADGSCNLGCC
jgi:hypothetical protein